MVVADTSETTNNIHGVRFNKTANIILSALRKSNLTEYLCIIIIISNFRHQAATLPFSRHTASQPATFALPTFRTSPSANITTIFDHN